MPRWKALPDELDPQVKEFAGQLRRLVDRSGLSIAALADRTGYSKTSWERYLGGRLLAPKGAIVALAEVTGADPDHLTTMWELAERAWSRAEMRHDMTMETALISRARAALGDLGTTVAHTSAGGDGTAARVRGATVLPGIAGPAGVSPTIPPQPTAPDADAREAAGSGRPSTGRAAPGPYGVDNGDRPRRPDGHGPAEARRRLTTFLAGAGTVLVVIAAVVLLAGTGAHVEAGDAAGPSAPSAPSVTAERHQPADVRCAGADCAGKDAESMGCSGEHVTTVRTATVGGTVVEVRYSGTCRTAWGRITGAAQGDAVRVSAGARKETGAVTRDGDTIAYTPMLAVRDAAGVKACVTLASGRRACTK
ncbi:helix-turn-helix domain-containing protein [Streptomyces sp. NPDC001843]|uniref:helix-turn-helix domain-containing protein n=1 Tax=Streptomyces sp. NPDC001843 TaxID=3364617 RepID=UPI0036966C0E